MPYLDFSRIHKLGEKGKSIAAQKIVTITFHYLFLPSKWQYFFTQQPATMGKHQKALHKILVLVATKLAGFQKKAWYFNVENWNYWFLLFGNIGILGWKRRLYYGFQLLKLIVHSFGKESKLFKLNIPFCIGKDVEICSNKKCEECLVT